MEKIKKTDYINVYERSCVMKKSILIGSICTALLVTSVFAVFKDVNKDSEYYKDIEYVENCGIFKGESEEIFSPNTKMTRAMIAQVIYNLENKPEYNKVKYDDVKETDWYFYAVSWIASNNLLKGIEDNKFEPDTLITKEDLITVLYNYAKYKGYDISVGEDTNILSYEDAFSLHEYGYAPFQWAISAGVIKIDDDMLNHDKILTRAEVASIMKNFSQKYVHECGWIKLEGNANTGYVWKASTYDKNVIFVDNYKYHGNNNTVSLVGAPGEFEFMVTALNEGDTEIVFEYMRLWENKPIRTIVCDVKVDSDGKLDILLKSDN